MTQESILIIKSWFSWAWQLLTAFYLPGTNVTPAAMLLFGASTYISIKFFTNLVGHGNMSDVGRIGANVNTRSNKGAHNKKG